jgi:ketosteroid isomerase-like protein
LSPRAWPPDQRSPDAGSYLRISVTPSGANAVQRAGYTLTILRKQPDGRWVLARDANLLTPQDPAS